MGKNYRLFIFFLGISLALAFLPLFSDNAFAQGTYKCVRSAPRGGCEVQSQCESGFKPGNCSLKQGAQGGFKCEPASAPCIKSSGGGQGTGAGGGGGQGTGAGGGGGQGTGGLPSIWNPLKYDTIPEILNAVAGFLYALALAVVTVMVLWGGFQILTAGGSPERIDKGKKTLLYAVVGTVFIPIAGGIADLTADILGGGTQPGPPAGSVP